MDWKTTINLVVSGLGIFVTVFLYVKQWYAQRRLIKTNFRLDLRRVIEKIDRRKGSAKEHHPGEYAMLFDLQSELETMDRKFVNIFGDDPGLEVNQSRS